MHLILLDGAYAISSNIINGSNLTYFVNYVNNVPDLFLIEICHVLIRAVFEIAPADEQIATRLEIDRVVQFLHTGPGKKITVKEMAERACMSPSHFARTFKKELGLPPLAYLLQARLGRAKKLLAAGDKSITEIALDCGFSSTSHFSSCFRRRFKISPRQFRNDLNKAG